MFVESRYLYVYGNTLVEFAEYFSIRSVRGLSYTLLTAIGQVSLTATVTCNQYYLLSCGADGAR